VLWQIAVALIFIYYYSDFLFCFEENIFFIGFLLIVVLDYGHLDGSLLSRNSWKNRLADFTFGSNS
jgi:hypothetical protein